MVRKRDPIHFYNGSSIGDNIIARCYEKQPKRYTSVLGLVTCKHCLNHLINKNRNSTKPIIYKARVGNKSILEFAK